MGRARDIANVLSSSTNIALDSEVALIPITPTSISVTGGSGSIGANGTVTFSSGSSVSLNGCFTSTYDHYKILSSNTGSSTIVALNLKMRANGSDSAALYYGGFTGANSEAASAVYGQLNGVSALRWAVAKSGETATVEARISNPFISSARTQFANSFTFSDGTTGRVYNGGGSMVTDTSFDGFSLIPESGTITGTVQVYGYRK
jgi:hypothetical protein